MPEKLGNGGHGREEYDPNTGKYMADGQPNKVYNNPEENGVEILSLDDFLPDLDDLDDTVSSQEIKEQKNIDYNNTSKKVIKEEKQTPLQKIPLEKITTNNIPIGKMTQEQLLTEISQRENNLKIKNIQLEENFFSDDIRIKCSVLRQIDNITEEYGINNFALGGLKISTFSDPADNTYAYTGMLTNGRRNTCSNVNIRFNRSLMKNYNDLLQKLKFERGTGWFSNVSDDFLINSIVCHEMGHVLENFAIDMAFKNSDLQSIIDIKQIDDEEEIYEETCNFIMNEVASVWRNSNPYAKYSEFSNSTSNYGKSSSSEWFAETFLLMKGGNQTPATLALKRWIEVRILNKQWGRKKKNG